MATAPAESEAVQPDPASPVMLFDGVCNLCNHTINFLIDRDPQQHLRFASLQSPAGQRLLKTHGLDHTSLKTVVLIENGQAYLRSTAVLRALRYLKWPWPLAYGLIVIPAPLRNLGYRLIARYRYRMFGSTESCRVPTPELKQRFLEN